MWKKLSKRPHGFVFLLYFLAACGPLDNELTGIDVGSISLRGFSDVEITVDGDEIKISVPWGTDRTRLVPVFTLTGAGTVVPASGKIQDFTRPVVYMVQHPSGGRKLYTIQVIENAPPVPALTGISHQEAVLGDTLRFWGSSLRGFLPQVVWKSPTGTGVAGWVERERDTLFRVQVPLVLAPGTYTLAMQVGEQPLSNPPKLTVHFPPPRLQEVLGFTYFSGDTLQLRGEYWLGGGYHYRGYLRQAGQEWTWDWTDQPAALPHALPAGSYDMRIENRSRRQSSPWQRVAWEIADRQKPHIWPNRIENRTAAWGDTLRFEARSWSGNATQLQLEHSRGMVVVTGYREPNNRVVYILPPTGPSGRMKLRFLFQTLATGDFFLANTTIQFR